VQKLSNDKGSINIIFRDFHDECQVTPKSIYYKEGNPNVVVVGTCILFKIFSGKLLDVAPKSRLADGVVTDYSRWSGCDLVDYKI
jgi:hypothetical protein